MKAYGCSLVQATLRMTMMRSQPTPMQQLRKTLAEDKRIATHCQSSSNCALPIQAAGQVSAELRASASRLRNTRRRSKLLKHIVPCSCEGNMKLIVMPSKATPGSHYKPDSKQLTSGKKAMNEHARILSRASAGMSFSLDGCVPGRLHKAQFPTGGVSWLQHNWQ